MKMYLYSCSMYNHTLCSVMKFKVTYKSPGGLGVNGNVILFLYFYCAHVTIINK